MGTLLKRGLTAWTLALILSLPAWTQFTPQEIAERPRWEEYLKTADITGYGQPWSDREAVTRPWRLIMEKDGLQRYAIWKDAHGRMRGYIEGWEWEIAAYRMDKLLDLNMIPPTVERRFRGKRGSCQLMVEVMSDLGELKSRNIKIPQEVLLQWNRNIYLQRAFDNLIANEDRHAGNYLVTEDYRMILIDHSRSFRTSRRYVERLIFTESHPEGPMVMRALPRAFMEKIRALTFAKIREAVGEYLTDEEIRAVLQRRDLIVKEIEARIARLGEASVLY